MDFSSLRQNLELEVYESLDAFERDVLLIFSNAASCNTDNTIYAMKAREIYKLIVKVFYTLRDDPKKLELEFSVPGRKPTSEVKTSEVIPNVATNEVKTSEVIPNAKLDTDVRRWNDSQCCVQR